MKTAQLLANVGMDSHLPWMTPTEIAIVETMLEKLPQPVKVLEYGCGYSSVYFSQFLKRAQKPYVWHCVESDREWASKVRRMCRSQKLVDTAVYLVDFRGRRTATAEFPVSVRDEYVGQFATLGGEFDLVIIDGRFRKRCLELVMEHAEDCIILLHDAERDRYSCRKRPGKSVVIETGVYPYLTTTKSKALFIAATQPKKLELVQDKFLPAVDIDGLNEMSRQLHSTYKSSFFLTIRRGRALLGKLSCLFTRPRPCLEALQEVRPGADGPRPIVFAVHQDFSARYLIGTDIFKKLRDTGVPLVILTPSADDPTFRSTFKIDGSNVRLARFRYDELSRVSNTLLHRFFSTVRYLTLPASEDIATVKFHELLQRLDVVGSSLRKRCFYSVVFLTARLLRRSRLLRRGFMRLETALVRSDAHADFFDRFKPGLLVTSDIGTTLLTALLLGEARRRNIPIVSIVLSWDNLTSKGISPVAPDYMVAWNDNMRHELACYHDAAPERIFVGGVAHFDRYFAGQGLSREAFFGKVDLATDKKTLFFGSGTPTFFHHNIDVIRLLLRAMTDGSIPEPSQLIVRLHPAYFTKVRHKRNIVAELEELDGLKQEYSDLLRLINPQTVTQDVGALLPIDDQDVLAGILKYSDVMVNVFSTLMLEACVFDLPVVNVAFYNYGETDIPNRRLKEFTHLNRTMNYGATREAYSEQELIELVNTYLSDRSVDSEARLRVRENEAGPNKGIAGATIARRIEEVYVKNGARSSFDTSNRVSVAENGSDFSSTTVRFTSTQKMEE